MAIQSILDPLLKPNLVTIIAKTDVSTESVAEGGQVDIVGGSLAKLEIDATISENHRYQTEATEHEVEEGLPITDNLRKIPIELSISGVITDTPNFLGSNRILTTILEKPSQNAFDFLEEIYENKYLCSLVTSVKEYDDLTLIDFNYKKSLEESGGLHFDLTFKELRFAEAAEGTVDDVDTADKSKSSSKKAQGTKKTSTATDAQDTKSSILYDLVS